MNILVVGGGKVGYYLVKTLLPYGHKIKVIEPDAGRCGTIAEELEIVVYNSDGTNIESLEDAGIRGTDIVVAVTGNDEINLLVCELAKKNFDIKKTVARVNNPKNEHIFNELGIGPAVSSTSLIASVIQNEVEMKKLRTLLTLDSNNLPTLDSGQMSMYEAVIEKTSPMVGRMIKDLTLPEDCVLVTIIRNGRIIFPRGGTVIQSGDEILAVTNPKGRNSLEWMIMGGKKL